jgi:hypothetical protein
MANLDFYLVRKIVSNFFIFICIFFGLIFISTFSYANSENFGMWQNIKVQTYSYNFVPAKALYSYLLKNNVPSDKAIEMVGIAGAESNYNPNIIVNNPKGGIVLSSGELSLPEYSVGLFQINLLAHHNALCNVYNVCNWDDQVNWLMNPYNNAKFAIYLSGNGQNFTPWTTYRNGRYVAYAEEFYNSYNSGR